MMLSRIHLNITSIQMNPASAGLGYSHEYLVTPLESEHQEFYEFINGGHTFAANGSNCRVPLHLHSRGLALQLSL